MKTLFLIFLFVTGLVACESKISRRYPYRETVDTRANDPATKSYVTEKYAGRAEGIYGLLWPENLNESDPVKLEKVITDARDLQNIRTAYTIENDRVLKELERLNCDCATSGLCEDGEDALKIPADVVAQCTQVDNDKISNDEKLALLYSQQLILKESVLAVGGDWLENEEVDLRLDFDNMKFNLSGLRFSNAEKKITQLEEPDQKLSFDKSKDRLFNSDSRFFWEARQGVKNGSLSWQFDGEEIPGTLQFQGEITLLLDGIERTGQMGFQLPSKL